MLYESKYYGTVNLGDSIAHHGIKGQKWGIRRFQNPDGTLTEEGKKRYGVSGALINAKTYNIDKWGKDPSHNILYITGMSGSGKSTAALNLADKNTDVIHLDIYLEKGSKEVTDAYDCKALNAYLDKKKIPFRKMRDGSLDGKDHHEERWKLIDDFTYATEEFGKQQYDKGRKVVMEGVQLSDQTMYPDKSELNGKPLAIVKTGSLTATKRAMERDEIPIYDIPTIAVRYRQQRIWKKSIKDLNKSMSLKRS